MENKGFVENGFIVDLADAKDASDIIYELSNILDIPEAQNKKICLKLGATDLSQSQLLSIKSLIISMNSELAIVDTNSEQTELSALNLGLIVSKLSNEIEAPETENLSFEIEGNVFVDNEKKDLITERIQPIEEFKAEEIIEKEADDEKKESAYEAISFDVDAEEEKVELVEKTEEEIEAEEKLEDLIDTENSQVTEEEESKGALTKLSTLYLQQTLRSGQTMSFDGNIVLIGDVHPGSEIIATGDITIWGVLGGIAHAGARGNDMAKIRALKLNAIQLRISGFYARRPDSMNIPFIQRTNEFTPEVAKVEDNEIAIFKTYEE